MSARIKFEDMTGTALGYVDLKGKSLVGSTPQMDYLIKDWKDNTPGGGTVQGFMSHYGDPDNSGSFLYSTLVDSDTDETVYPA